MVFFMHISTAGDRLLVCETASQGWALPSVLLTLGSEWEEGEGP